VSRAAGIDSTRHDVSDGTTAVADEHVARARAKTRRGRLVGGEGEVRLCRAGGL
jgi:hypothetical protein